MKTEPKSSITEQLNAAIQRVHNEGLGHTECYANGMALRNLHTTAARAIQTWLTIDPVGGDPLQPEKSIGHVYGLIKSTQFIEFTALDAAHRANETSEAFQTALAIVQPLVDEARRANETSEAFQTALAIVQPLVDEARRLEALQAAELASYGKRYRGLRRPSKWPLPRPYLPSKPTPRWPGFGHRRKRRGLRMSKLRPSEAGWN